MNLFTNYIIVTIFHCKIADEFRAYWICEKVWKLQLVHTHSGIRTRDFSVKGRCANHWAIHLCLSIQWPVMIKNKLCIAVFNIVAGHQSLQVFLAQWIEVGVKRQIFCVQILFTFCHFEKIHSQTLLSCFSLLFVCQMSLDLVI